ncbi:TetR/AcrR family transcriptional regulator [Actinokineospora sp. UTMC 2448]|uniref:TetR/AcrR family transcriptional regulator n=1 Tax=Actinokineospora sp. UTMC 2448 TaxID=2268449 RepID=UPI0021649F8F|nr:TetR/AcrR family transcriptional regulator [Actinokineospora sp. UTMC 2448]UVS81648.1 HTH-type transcriptional regulator MtrR [Actinokineospora sp. UTMC 2448]
MTSDTPLRADARRNRARIVAAAREVFATRGIDVTLDEIARVAGVGVGTVYRRFSSKEALLEAVFDEVVSEVNILIDAAAAEPDAWTGLVGLLTAVAERQAADRGLFQICHRVELGHAERIGAHFVPAVDSLVARAQAQGTIRPDVTGADLGPLMTMLGASFDLTRHIAPDLWRRYFTLLLDGLRLGPPTPLPVASPSHDDIHEAMKDKGC